MDSPRDPPQADGVSCARQQIQHQNGEQEGRPGRNTQEVKAVKVQLKWANKFHWMRALVEKLIVAKLVKKFLAWYENQMLITMLTR
jgi:hypothetical protein